jgi:uncharacterized protein YbjT (DUF2867 family)
MAKTILITGATGKVSSGVIEKLAKSADVRLRALVRDREKAAHLAAAGIELAVGDLDKPRSLPPAFEGVDTVWLLSPSGPLAPFQQSNGLWAARQAGVRRVIRMSAVGAAHDAPTVNSRMHALSDTELMQSGLAWIVLKPHFFMQNLLGSAGPVKAQGVLYSSMAEGRLGMIDTRDIVDFTAKLLSSDGHDGRVYTLTGPQSIDFSRVASALATATGKPIKYVATPLAATREAFVKMGASDWNLIAVEDYIAAYARNWGDFVTDEIPKLLGRPALSIDDFAREFATAFR